MFILGYVVTRGVARASSARLASEQGRQLQEQAVFLGISGE